MRIGQPIDDVFLTEDIVEFNQQSKDDSRCLLRFITRGVSRQSGMKSGRDVMRILWEAVPRKYLWL